MQEVGDRARRGDHESIGRGRAGKGAREGQGVVSTQRGLHRYGEGNGGRIDLGTLVAIWVLAADPAEAKRGNCVDGPVA